MQTSALRPLALLAIGAASPEVPYPEGFRQWEHVESGYVGPGSPAHPRFGGIHNIYANRKAMKGYRSGAFPAGSTIVFDVREAKATPGNFEPGTRKQIDVMTKDRSGWRFVEFAGDSRTERGVGVEAGKTECLACHRNAKRDFVFTSYSG
jgi:hypothetical protein